VVPAKAAASNRVTGPATKEIIAICADGTSDTDRLAVDGTAGQRKLSLRAKGSSERPSTSCGEACIRGTNRSDAEIRCNVAVWVGLYRSAKRKDICP